MNKIDRKLDKMLCKAYNVIRSLNHTDNFSFEYYGESFRNMGDRIIRLMGGDPETRLQDEMDVQVGYFRWAAAIMKRIANDDQEALDWIEEKPVPEEYKIKRR
jgi:hypothetical protein